MPRCSASKPNGSPCERIVGASQEYCYSHDPQRSKERHRAASKAAKSKPNRELSEVKGKLSQLANDVVEGRMDRGDAAVASQVLNVYLRAVTVELKVKEVIELEERLEALEQTQKQEGSNRRWG